MECQLEEGNVSQKKEWFEFWFKKDATYWSSLFFHGTHWIWLRQTHRPPRRMYARLLLWRSQSQPVYHGIIATPSLLHSGKSKVIVVLIATPSWESGVPLAHWFFRPISLFSQEHINKLATISFQFCPRNKKPKTKKYLTWNERYNELVLNNNKNGHPNPSREGQLGSWWRQQCQNFNKSSSSRHTIYQHQIDKLIAIGFQFNLPWCRPTRQCKQWGNWNSGKRIGV